MALKGVCEIELKDENGNIVKKTRDKNMLTNALSRLLNPDMFMLNLLYATNIYMYEFYNTKLPILDKLIGGILLFNQTQDEKADNVTYSANDVIGSGSVMTKLIPDDNRIGTFNKEESSIIKDSNGNDIGIKFVWDFATNQCNGTIRSVSLTSGLSGEFLYSNGDRLVLTLKEGLNSIYPMTFLKGGSSSDSHTDTFPIFSDSGSDSRMSCIFLTQFKPDELIVIPNSLEMNRIKIKKNINLTDKATNLCAVGSEILKTVPIKDLGLSSSATFSAGLCFVNFENSLYYCIVKNKILRIVKYDPETLEATEKNIDCSSFITSNGTYSVSIYNNYFVILGSTLFFLDINDYTLVKTLTLNASLTYTGQYGGYFIVTNLDGTNTIMLDKELNVIRSQTATQREGIFKTILPQKNDYVKAPYFMYRNNVFFNNSSRPGYGIGIDPHVKFTIDNLATPVTKTASQTMKVIYTIQDVVEEN